jgi:transcriptional regulator with XRE-family HTH domain
MLFIAENLKILRKEKSLTQEEVAEILSVSPQSVSKWERGDTLPDITLLPTLANFYKVTVDALIGMDKINDYQTRNAVFTIAHNHWRKGDMTTAIEIYSEGLKTFPNDTGIMSDMAMALALEDDPVKLSQAVSLCERVLSNNQGDKVHHTTRAALCFIYMKVGEKDKAISVANGLPHIRESRETIIEQIERELTVKEIDSFIRFIAIGDNDEQDIICIDFGMDMIPICTEHDLLGKISALRDEVGAPSTNEGLRILPQIRIRDNIELSSNRVRVRNYTDYLIDKDFQDPAEAVNEIIESIRKIAISNIANLSNK